jgi:ABC-2 type transport system ATP-binding protein
MSETAIRATGLHKSYGDKEAVRGLDFEVERGRIFGLIGPNGAGKSSTIRMLMGLSRPDRGSVEVFGEEATRMQRSTRQRIGYLSEQSVEDHGLPLSGLLRYHSAFFPTWDWDRVDDLVRRIDVPKDRPLDELSAGQRRRCELVLTLAPDPDLLVLDDPTVGLDATVRRDFLWAALELARDDGKTIVFTSHVLHDVERIVDTVAILREGRLAAYDELDALLGRTKRVVLRGAASDEVPALDGELSRETRGADLIVVTERFDDDLERALRGRHDAVVENLNLEELFCEHAGVEGAQ